MTFFRKALGTLLSLQLALLAPAAALAQSQRVFVVPVAPLSLAVRVAPLPTLPAAAVPGPDAQAPISVLPGAPVSAEAKPETAAASLSRAQAAVTPQASGAASSPVQDAVRLDGFWSGAAAASGSEPSLARSGGAFALGAVAAPELLGRLDRFLGPAQGYAAAGAVLAGTYALHRGVRRGIDAWAARRGWDPNTRDNARFAGAIATWMLGAAIGLHVAHLATAKLVAVIGLAVSFAVKDSISNVLQGVLLLVRRPFSVGEKIRIGDTMYEVANLETQYVVLRKVAQLLTDRPDSAPAGYRVVALAEIDPLGRSVDDKGRKYALVPVPAPAEAPSPLRLLRRRSYSRMAANPYTMFREYIDTDSLAELARLRGQLHPKAWRVPVKPILSAILATPRRKAVRAAIFVAAAAAMVPLVPILQAHLTFLGIQALFPFLHFLLALWATHTVSRLANAMLPIFAQKLGWRTQTLVIARLGVQAAIFIAGMTSALGALSKDWESVMASLGVTAAATAWASADILTNFSKGVVFRFTQSLRVGEFLGVGSDYAGNIQEMRALDLVVQPARDMHTVVPYSAISDNDFDTPESDTGDLVNQ